MLLEFKVRVNEDTKAFYIILQFNRFVINKYRNGFSELFVRRMEDNMGVDYLIRFVKKQEKMSVMLSLPKNLLNVR